MIADLDEVLRKLLIREMAIKRSEVDIQFDQPKREWSSRLSKPTINLFLFDIRENLRLRMAEQYLTITRGDGNTEVRRNPVRLDLRYLMTAWVKDAADEHLLLSSALMGLLRNPFIPADLITGGLKTQPVPVPVDVANFPPEVGPVDKFTELWGVLDNEMRPGILVTITLSVDPYKPQVFPPVRSREARILQKTGLTQTTEINTGNSLDKTYLSVAGVVKSDKYDPSTLSMVLVENNTNVALDNEGRYSLHNIIEGEHHLDIYFNQKVLKRQKITVPAPNYDIQV